MAGETEDNPTPTPPAPQGKKKAPAKNGGIGLLPLSSALKAVAKGDYTARAEFDRLEGESADLAQLLNQVLDQVSTRNAEFEARKQQTVHVVDQALDALIALVRQGEPSKWQGDTPREPPPPALARGLRGGPA